MKTLASLFRDQTSDFNLAGRILTLVVLSVILAGVLSILVGVVLSIVQGENINFKY